MSTMEQTEPPRYRVLLYATAFGLPLEEFVEELGLTVKAASDVLASPFMQDELEKIKESNREKIREAADGDAVDKELAVAQLDAVHLVGDTIKNGDEKALGAALKILELRERSKPQKLEVDTTHRIQLTEDQAQNLMAGVSYVREQEPKLLESRVVSSE